MDILSQIKNMLANNELQLTENSETWIELKSGVRIKNKLAWLTDLCPHGHFLVDESCPEGCHWIRFDGTRYKVKDERLEHNRNND